MNLRSRSTPRGFTLVEVLAAILIIAIVLPAAMGGISLCTMVVGTVRHRTEATTLAQNKLNELLVTGDWQNGSRSGDFGDRWPDYRWTAEVTAFDSPTIQGLTSSLQQLDVDVTWVQRGKDQHLTLTTLVYQTGTTTGTTQ